MNSHAAGSTSATVAAVGAVAVGHSKTAGQRLLTAWTAWRSLWRRRRRWKHLRAAVACHPLRCERSQRALEERVRRQKKFSKKNFEKFE